MSKTLDRLIASKRLPVLFLGAGISKRYLSDYPSWSQLLDQLREKIGVSKPAYAAKESEIKSHNPAISDGMLNQYMASYLQEKLLQKIQDDNIDLDTLFTHEEIDRCITGHIDFFKMLVAKSFFHYSIKEEKSAELELFKQISSKISMAFTTNYDMFLQEQVLKDFKVYDSQNKYYFRTSNGYGELYMIHGCITNPNGIVICQKDYEVFDSSLKLISSKLINALLDYPIIFLGYSLEDENIKKILGDFVSSFDDSILQEVKGYMVLVEYEADQSDLIEGEKQFTDSRSGKSFTLTTIKTDNFASVYQYINKLTPCATSYELRKYKTMVAELISKEAKGEKKVFVQELDEAKADVQALYIGTRQSIEGIERSVMVYEKDDVMRKALKSELLDCDAFAKYWFESRAISSNEYTPVFYFASRISIPYNDCSPKFRKNKENVEQNFALMRGKMYDATMEAIESKYSDLKTDSGKTALSISNVICRDLIDALLTNSITVEQCHSFLLRLMEDYPSILGASPFKKCACYMWYREYKKSTEG